MARAPRFDATWQSKRRWRTRWRALRWPLLVAAILAASAWLLNRPTSGGEWEALAGRVTLCGSARGSQVCVVDGDTILVGRRRVRLTGFNAPKLDSACAAEREAAVAARAELLQWLRQDGVQLDGGASPPRDRYGRELRNAPRVDASGRES